MELETKQKKYSSDFYMNNCNSYFAKYTVE